MTDDLAGEKRKKSMNGDRRMARAKTTKLNNNI